MTFFQCDVCGKFIKTAQGLKSHTTRLHKDVQVPSVSQPGPSDVNGSIVTDPVISLDAAADPDQIDSDEFLRLMTSLKSSVRIIRRIPKGARSAAAYALSDVIDRCINENSVSAWKTLFLFSRSCFHLPDVQGNKHDVSLATLVTRNINSFRLDHRIPDAPLVTSNAPVTHRAPDSSSEKVPVKLIQSKISEGDIKGAVRILSSNASLAPFNNDTLDKLKLLHPPAVVRESAPAETPTALPNVSQLDISVDAIKKAIASFPTGSSGGLDLLRPDHLKDLTSFSAGAAGVRLLSSLSDLCTLMLRGLVPAPFCPFLYGASLCALSKKDGGVRPIAVGCVFRRLVAKLGCAHIFSKLGVYLQPTQFGFGISGGAEAVAHAARRFVSFPHLTPKILLKLDFSNAFNSVHRDIMLQEASQHIPELLPFLNQCYNLPSHLFFGSDVISSTRGIQQGDPLGPALFCLVVKPISSSLHSELNLWYLDDAALGGTIDDVLHDYDIISRESNKLGLNLNDTKCELYPLGNHRLPDNEIQNQFPSSGPCFSFPNPENWTLLGAPLTDAAIVKTVDSKVTDLSRLVSRLSTISAHYAFYVLKNALAIPKLLYTLRCSPTWKATASLQAYDSSLFAAVQTVTNICLSDEAAIQASLPIAEGGLGLRKATNLSTAAFLSSTVSVSSLVEGILPSYVSAFPDILFEEGISMWTSATGLPLPPLTSRASQGAWERGHSSLTRTSLQDRATSLQEKARLLGVSSRESGSFLQAVPSPSLGTFLDDNTFRIALSLRLGLDICEPHLCPCGATVDKTGLHGLSCKRSSGRSFRHAAVNDLIKRALGSAGIPSFLEPTALCPDSQLRPDGVTLMPWRGGKALIWDFTCVDGLAPTYVDSSAGIHLYAATRAETLKKLKYASLNQTYTFAPIAVECLGGFGTESLQTLKNIAKKLKDTTGEKRSSEFLFQRLSVAVQRGNAISVLGTLPRDAVLDDF